MQFYDYPHCAKQLRQCWQMRIIIYVDLIDFQPKNTQ